MSGASSRTRHVPPARRSPSPGAGGRRASISLDASPHLPPGCRAPGRPAAARACRRRRPAPPPPAPEPVAGLRVPDGRARTRSRERARRDAAGLRRSPRSRTAARGSGRAVELEPGGVRVGVEHDPLVSRLLAAARRPTTYFAGLRREHRCRSLDDRGAPRGEHLQVGGRRGDRHAYPRRGRERGLRPAGVNAVQHDVDREAEPAQRGVEPNDATFAWKSWSGRSGRGVGGASGLARCAAAAGAARAAHSNGASRARRRSSAAAGRPTGPGR